MYRLLAAPVALLVVALLAIGCSSTGADPSSEVPDQGRALRPAADGTGPRLPGDLLDMSQPTIRNLDPDLLDALRDAAADAEADGVHLVVTSGWRSRSHQQRLFTEAVAKYGSEAEALRYVSTPDASAHVTGDAVDIGPTEGADWLGRHGSAHGLCQVFANEMWHFELATSPGGTCPEMLPDGSYR